MEAGLLLFARGLFVGNGLFFLLVGAAGLDLIL